MPPRIPLLSVIRHPNTYTKTQVCQFSKNTPSQAIRRNLPQASSGSQRLLDLDTSPSPSSPNSSTTSQASTRSPTDAATSLLSYFRADVRSRNANGAPAGEERVNTEDSLRQKNSADEYMRQMPRRFNVGDVYAPHDLSPVEMRKWRKTTTVQRDLVDLLGLRPLDMYRNFAFISEYMTHHGRVKRAELTGLRPANQRKVAKAIRRAIGLGIHPSVHRHPEILMREARTNAQQNAPTGKMGNFYSV
ncbi:ribosomal protein S18 [Xylariales sp. AK1849]|nr:ribosomal protein S18 [Xylariales sp. AK1849]